MGFGVAVITMKGDSTMKKSVRILALVMALTLLTLALVACGNTLSGSYTKKGWLTNTTLEFSGKNVTITMGSLEAKGTYTIEDDKITIEFPEDEDDTKLDAVIKGIINELVGTKSFEKTDDGIKIGGVEYKKN